MVVRGLWMGGLVVVGVEEDLEEDAVTGVRGDRSLDRARALFTCSTRRNPTHHH